MSITIYGIRNCDTMKKAFTWLAEHGVAHTFHDYRKDGIAPATLARWCEAVGWEALVNRRGTTWRKLDPSQQALTGTGEAIALMAAHPSVIRRPVIETARGELLVGFEPARYASALTTPESRP
jgi:Spx/MgsR family transcriptional regulator